MVTPAVTFAVPGSLDTPTGGYAYDARIIAELRRLGWHVDVLDLGEGFPHPTPETYRQARLSLARLPIGRAIIVDGLALGVMPAAAEGLRNTHAMIALVHHPLALETGLPAKQANALRVSERAALAAVRHVIVSSPSTARLLAKDYGVTEKRVTVALPGTDVPTAAREERIGSVALLAVGSMVPRKGYDVLLAALSELRDLDWRLTVAGAQDRDPATAAKIESQIAELGLQEHVTLRGALPSDRLGELYAAADVFVLASRFEGYGMAYADAVAHGLPIIGTTAGAIPETVPEGAGILVPPDDVAALTTALRTMVTDRETRARYAAAAREAAGKLPTWEAAAQAFVQVLRSAA